MKRKYKVIIFISLIVLMMFYIGWVFYQSEPKYIDNCNKKVERYDYVSIPDPNDYNRNKGEVINGIILQVDSASALIKCDDEYDDEFYQLNLINSQYRIVGKGTSYHKINSYVGFNIMLITQIFIAILCFIIIGALVNTFSEIFKDKR